MHYRTLTDAELRRLDIVEAKHGADIARSLRSRMATSPNPWQLSRLGRELAYMLVSNHSADNNCRTLTQEDFNMTDILTRLRALNADREDIDDLVVLLTFGTLIGSNYASVGLPVPSWLTEATDTVRTEIASRRRDQLLKRQKELDREERALRTREERRLDLQREKEEISKLLGVTPVAG